MREEIVRISLKELKLLVVIEHAAERYGPKEIEENTDYTGNAICYNSFHHH